MLLSEAHAHAAAKLIPLPLRQVEEVLDLIEDVHFDVSIAKLRELARMHCRGESAEGAALRRLVEALKGEPWFPEMEQYKAREYAQRVLRGEV